MDAQILETARERIDAGALEDRTEELIAKALSVQLAEHLKNQYSDILPFYVVRRACEIIVVAGAPEFHNAED